MVRKITDPNKFRDKTVYLSWGQLLAHCHLCNKEIVPHSPRNRWHVCDKCRNTKYYYDPRDTARRILRRAEMKALEASITPLQILRVYEFFEFKCAYCGSVATDIEHIIPLSSGGGSVVENLLPVCRSCNSSKNHKTGIPDWVIPERLAKIAEYFALEDLDNPPYRVVI